MELKTLLWYENPLEKIADWQSVAPIRNSGYIQRCFLEVVDIQHAAPRVEGEKDGTSVNIHRLSVVFFWCSWPITFFSWDQRPYTLWTKTIGQFVESSFWLHKMADCVSLQSKRKTTQFYLCTYKRDMFVWIIILYN